jgi:hypothetical protein
MKRRPSHDVWEAFHLVTDAAEQFVNRSPRSKRLETERQALLDAIRRAQLVLSVNRLSPSSSASEPSVTSLADFRARRKDVKESSGKRRKGGR